MKKFNFTALLMCAAFCASCTAQPAQTTAAETTTEATTIISETAVPTTTAVAETTLTTTEAQIVDATVLTTTGETTSVAEIALPESGYIEFATEQEYIDYLNGLDRTNEAVVMSDEEFREFIELTAPTAQNFNWLFGVYSAFDYGEEIIEIDGNNYCIFLEDKCSSLDDLWTYMGEYYSASVIENAKSVNSDMGLIIEHNGHIYEHEGEKGTAVYTYPERAEIVFQEESRITFSIPVGEGDADEFIRLCTISKNGDKWTYDQWFQ